MNQVYKKISWKKMRNRKQLNFEEIIFNYYRKLKLNIRNFYLFSEFQQSKQYMNKMQFFQFCSQFNVHKYLKIDKIKQIFNKHSINGQYLNLQLLKINIQQINKQFHNNSYLQKDQSHSSFYNFLGIISEQDIKKKLKQPKGHAFNTFRQPHVKKIQTRRFLQKTRTCQTAKLKHFQQQTQKQQNIQNQQYNISTQILEKRKNIYLLSWDKIKKKHSKEQQIKNIKNMIKDQNTTEDQFYLRQFTKPQSIKSCQFKKYLKFKLVKQGQKLQQTQQNNRKIKQKHSKLNS